MVKFPLSQKQLTSMTLLQFALEMPVSKHVVAQGGTPLRLGNCAVLVEVALKDELTLCPLGLGDVAVELVTEALGVDEAGVVVAGLLVSDVAAHVVLAPKRRAT